MLFPRRGRANHFGALRGEQEPASLSKLSGLARTHARFPHWRTRTMEQNNTFLTLIG
jgi:hypothetical protein